MKIRIPLSFILGVLIIAQARSASSLAEIDAAALVYKVIDGDTFDAFPVGRVRLADVDTPERGEPGYDEAKEFLRLLTYGGRVYLDVDDYGVMDRYNRLVCVVYVRYNSSHLLNVNLALLIEGLAVISDYDNEFNPYAWTLYVYYPTTALPETYDELLQVYLELKSNYEELNSTYNELRGEYAFLEAKYAHLKRDYDALIFDYDRLKADYDALNISYDKLKNDYESLKSIHEALSRNYEELKSDYDILKSEYEAGMDELSLFKKLTTTFMATTVIAAAAAVLYKKKAVP